MLNVKSNLCWMVALGLWIGSTAPVWSQTRDIGTTEVRPAEVRQEATPAERGLSPELKRQIERDPLKAARPVKAGIETWGARAAKSVEEFEELVRGLDLRRIEDQKIALSELRLILGEVQEAADAILDGYGPFQTNFELYRKAVTQAPAAYEALADSFQKKAADQEHQDLAAVYADFAETNRRLAKRYRERSEELLKQQEDIESKVRFVRQSKIVLRDVQELLDVIPATEEGEAVEAYVRRVNEYVDGFLKVINAVKGTADKIGEPKPPTSPGKKPQPQPALGKNSATSEPIAVSEYRRRLQTMRPQ